MIMIIKKERYYSPGRSNSIEHRLGSCNNYTIHERFLASIVAPFMINKRAESQNWNVYKLRSMNSCLTLSVVTIANEQARTVIIYDKLRKSQ